MCFQVMTTLKFLDLYSNYELLLCSYTQIGINLKFVSTILIQIASVYSKHNPISNKITFDFAPNKHNNDSISGGFDSVYISIQ